jgi:hypothetical protein
VWHIAALVGPYYERQAYYNVNYTCVVPGRVVVLLRQHLVTDLRLGLCCCTAEH